MRRFFRKKIVYLAKLRIGFILVGWILSRVDSSRLTEYFLQLKFWPLAAVILLSSCGLYVQFRRWRFLVESNSAHFETRDLLPSFFAGFAFRLMIPGGHAEVSKIFLLPGRKRGKAVAFGMEKFFQTYIKVLLITAAVPLTFPEYGVWCAALLAVLVIAYFLLPRIPWLKYFQEKEVNNHAVFFKTLLFSVAVFLVMAFQYFILLNQVHKIDLMQTLQTVVFMWGAGLVPVSISGLGVREGLAVYFLQMYNFPPAYAVATSLFLFTLNAVFPAAIGAVIIYRKREYLKDIRETIKSSGQIWQTIRNGNDTLKKSEKTEMNQA